MWDELPKSCKSDKGTQSISQIFLEATHIPIAYSNFNLLFDVTLPFSKPPLALRHQLLQLTVTRTNLTLMEDPPVDLPKAFS